MRPRLAALALAALLAALAACSGGAAPPEASPPIEATSTPAPAAAATPDARSGLELIESAPGAFVHRTFEDGEAIGWAHGIFVLDAETGLTEGYAVAGLESYEHYYRGHRGGWIETSDGSFGAGRRLLLDRQTGRSWRWPRSALRLRATSGERLLFEETAGNSSASASASRFIVANRLLEEVARFSVDPGVGGDILFSPDGRGIVFAASHKVYLVSAATGARTVLFDPPPRHGEQEYLRLRWVLFDSRQRPPFVASWIPHGGGRGIVATAGYGRPEADANDTDILERRYFGWTGEELPAPACPGALSPDGRYAAVRKGGVYYGKYTAGYLLAGDPWPFVTIADADTCAPIFRVLSAHDHEGTWGAAWLSTGDGFVVGVDAGHAIAQVRPAPALIPLPRERHGPEAAPTGGGRYFGYGARVYDAAEDRWYGRQRSVAPFLWGEFWWGGSHRERWFNSHADWGDGGSAVRLLLPPKIEYPPFSEEIAFRVARTGDCLPLREEPGEEGRVLRCLPDGARLLFAERDAEAERDWAGRILSPHPSIALLDEAWVYVRTEGGAEGWVSHDWLDHD